ncbi:hypothetical protein NLI96_g986 [Meripilus lineatus]|uniref:Uncharacterized protein n=1 Tax=Meripilus lineatus TaxID=2056292 RepID=A0AAD5VBA1_9APHY|nr:hypothetical protein NLI96_g986 [Physisporinus lineatus]
MFSRYALIFCAVFVLVATFANAEPIDFERRQDLGSIFNDVTSGAASAFSVATEVGASVFSDATSVGAGIATKVTSIGGHAATVITSAGGQAITLATDGFGVATTFAGSVYTVATAAAASQISANSNPNGAVALYPTTLLTSLAAVAGGLFAGVWIIL